MKRIYKILNAINSFSRKILKLFLIFSVFLTVSGALLFKYGGGYYRTFLAKKIMETGMCFIFLGFLLAFLTDYLYKNKM